MRYWREIGRSDLDCFEKHRCELDLLILYRISVLVLLKKKLKPNILQKRLGFLAPYSPTTCSL
jgi:hypothetical protein